MAGTHEIRIGLLGAGRIGRVHADAVRLTPGARIVAVADAMDEAAQGLAADHGSDVRRIDAIIEADDIDAVLVCTPTDMHADLIEAAARAGKAAFCEKPIALDLDRTRAALRVVEEAGTQLMVGFNRRFDPHYVALREAIDAGTIGAVEMVAITSRDPSAPPIDYIQRSGGLFKDMTIHDLDEARWMLGEEIATVSAHGAVLTDPAIEEAGDIDSATVTLQTASGRIATISNSRRATYGYDQRVEVHGSLGVARAENPRTLDIEIGNADGTGRPPGHDFFMTRYASAYRAEIGAFIDAVRSGEAMRPSGRDGMMALALAEAAGISMCEGRRVAVTEVLGDDV